jgi:hypothetical protein
VRTWVRQALGVVIVASVLGAAGLAWLAFTEGKPAAVLTDMDGRRVALEEAPELEGADMVPTGGRFLAPSQGIDVPLVKMSPSGGVVNPPTLTDAFLLRDPHRGSDAGTRARVVAMHAVRDGRAPGNAFFEPGAPDPSLTVAPGDELFVDGARYVVESTEVLMKGDAARSPEIWGYHPDGEERLVVLTCLQRSSGHGPAPENLVLHAVRA